MTLKQTLALLATMLPLLGSGLANATLMETTTTYTDIKSWGSNNELSTGSPSTVPAGDPYNITTSFTSSTGAPDGYTIETIDFSGVASAVTLYDTAGQHLFVNILYGASNLGSFQLGSGDYSLGQNVAFSGLLDVVDTTVTAGGVFSFRFYENLSDQAFWEGESYSEDAIWNSIVFNLNGTAIPFCTAHPTDPACSSGGGGGGGGGGSGGGTIPEPATLALLGLGLTGLGLMRRRIR